MKTNKISQSEIVFNAKVSQQFVHSMRGYVNNGSNRLKNNYQLTKKIEDYAHFGYDDYTVMMQQRYGSMGYEYSLYAVRDGEDIRDGINLTPKPYTSYRKIFRRFMQITKYDFENLMRKYM